MKTNFNTQKNVRNSHFTSALSVLRKLQSLGLIGIALIMGSLQVWGDTWTRVTSISELTGGGTFIMGYEATAKSGVIIPLRSYDCNATTNANGYFYTGTTDASSTNGTIDMSDPGTTTKYEVYISSPTSGKINIQMGTSSGNYYGATSGGTTSSNKGRLYTSGNSNETNLTPEWASEENNQFKLTAGVSGEYKYLKYNTSNPRFAFYKSAGEKIVFYKKGAADPHTVTFNAQGGTCGTSSLTGTSVTLPVASPSSACASEGWAFYGWATAAVASSTTTAPTIVGKAGDTYHPTNDIILHAVYAQGEYTKETSAITSGSKYLIVANSTKNYVMTDSYSLNGSEGQMASVQIDETSSNKYHAAAVNANWCYTIEGTAGHYYIRDVKNSSDANYIDIAYQDWYGKGVDSDDQFTITVSSSNWTLQGNWNHSKGWAYEDLAFDGSDKVFIRGSGTVLLYKETTTPAYWSNPSCCDKAVAVSYNSAGSTYVSAMSFSAASTATCGDAASRRVTITVTPTSGYLFKAGDVLTWTKSSGTIPAAPTKVSGPTLNAGKYEFVYEFAQNDNGAGTFAAAASTLTNYRTVCCTEYDIALNNSGSTTGGSFSASKAKACEDNTVTLTATPDACYVFGSWTIKKHSDNSDVTASVLAGNTLTMPDYAVDVYASFISKTVSALSLSMTGGHQNLDIGGTNQLLVTYTPADATCDNAISTWSSSNSLILSVSNSGLVTAVSAGNATITATTEGGVSNTYTITVNSPACDSWYMHHWNNSTNGDECFYQYSGTDWRTNNISLPSNSSEEKFNVNNAASNPDAKKTDVEFNTLGFADIQRGGYSCGSNPYPGQNAYGKMGIYTNSGDNNRYVAFYPDKYMVTYGKEDQAWSTLTFSNTTGYEYESPVFQVPSGYKNDNTYKYYVGINNSSDAILFVNSKSSTDAMNGVSGLSSSDLGGKWGKWHIYSNSCDANWYCTFIRYYQVDFAMNGGEGSISPRYGKGTSPYESFSTSEITPPTKSGYTFIGWSDGVNTYAPTGATVTIDADKTLTAQWAANHTLTYDMNGGDGTSCDGATTYYTGQSFTACTGAGDKTGYNFGGWSGSNSVNYTAGSSYSMPDADLTLTAIWNANVYAVTLNANSGTINSGDVTTYTFGAGATLPTDVTRDGYRFDGWYAASNFSGERVYTIANNSTGDKEYWAKWTQIRTITWKVWNESTNTYDNYTTGGPTTEVENGGTIATLPTAPSALSCTSVFKGWSATELGSDLGQSAPADLFTSVPAGTITANKTYYAVFAKQNSAAGFPINMSYNAHSYVSASSGDISESDTKGFYVQKKNSGFYWLFTIPVSNIEAGSTISITLGNVSVSNNSYKFTYQMSYSTNNSDYTNVGNTFTESTTATNESQTFIISNKIVSGNIYIKWLSTSGGGTNGGNHYIKTVEINCTPPAYDYVTSCCDTDAPTNGGYSNVTGSGSTMSAKVTWDDEENTNRYRVVCTDLSIDAITTNKYYTTEDVMTSCTDYTFNVYAAPEGGCMSAPLEIIVSPVEAAKTVTFNYNGSGQAAGSFTTDCTHSSTTLPTPSAYAGHRFDGWWTLASGGSSIGAAGASYTPTADIEIFAHWVAIADLTYSGDATGTCTGTSSKDVGTSVTACTPASREHYTFDYWIRSDNSDHVNAGATFTMPASALTLTAHWTADSYSITYKDKGNVAYSGSNSSSLPATYSYGTGVPSLPNGVKEGFRFDGWFDNSDCTGSPITTISTTATGVKTFYAKWTASYTFTFSKKGVVDGTLTLGQVEGGNVVMPNTTVDCGLWTTFEGWVESDVTETTTEPATVYKPGDIFVAGNSDKEFKALYSKHEGDATVSYEKVASNSVTPSGEYVIASPDGNTILTGLNANKRGTHEAVTISDGVIASKGNGVVLKVNKKGNLFNIKMSGDTKYITTTSDTYFEYSVTDGASACMWELTSDGYIHSTTHDTRYIEFLKSGGTLYFGAYTGTQYKSFLYRKRVAGTTYYATAPASCAVPTEITVSYNDNKAHAGDQTISGTPSGTTLDFTTYPNFASYTIGAAPTDPTGYHFAGWNTSADGSGDAYAAGASVTTFGYTETITLYAQWERVYTVTLMDNGTKRDELTEEYFGAGVVLPEGNNCTPSSEFTFVGWTESAVQLNADPIRPATLHAAGAYTPTGDITLYSVYSSTIDGCDDFAAGVSGAYTMYYNGSTYATTAGTSGSYTGATSGTAEVFYIAYAPSHTGYTISTSAGYLGWNHDGSELTKGNTTPYYWKISGSSSNWVITPEPSAYTKQLKSSDGNKFQLYAANTGGTLLLQKSAMTYYFNTAICGDNRITFHDGGGAISGTPTTPDGSTWNSTTNVLSGLENCDKVTDFPTASYDGWTFVGWSTEDYSNSGKHVTDYAEENASTDEPDGSIIYKTDGNSYTVRGGNIDLYPVFTRFPENEPFDMENGGEYYMYYLKPGTDDGYGAPIRVYAGDYQDLKRYKPTTSCATATLFTFTKDGDVWHIYDNTTGKYLKGRESNDDLQQAADLSEELDDWTITIKNGNQFDASCQGYGRYLTFSTSANNFMDYSVTANPSICMPVYLGSCTERIYSSEPSPVPTIDLTGEPMVTSSAGQTVRAATPLTLSGSHLAGATKITLTGTNLKFATSATTAPVATLEIPVSSGGVAATDIYVFYTPAAGDTEDGIENLVVTAAADDDDVTKTTSLVQVRHLPSQFVIAAKAGSQWLALTAKVSGMGTQAAVPIIVDDETNPTSATVAMNTSEYSLFQLPNNRPSMANSRFQNNSEAVHLYSNVTGKVLNPSTSSATSTHINTGASRDGAGDSPNCLYYEWKLVSTDLVHYTVTNCNDNGDLASNRVLGYSTGTGQWGMYSSGANVNQNLLLLPIETILTDMEVEVMEWGTSSMALRFVNNTVPSAVDVQLGNTTMSNKALTNIKSASDNSDIYKVEGLTLNAHDCKVIKITDHSDATKGTLIRKPILVNASSSASTYRTNLTDETCASCDIVILNGGRLTANQTSADHTDFANIYVYPGGKLILDGNSLGVKQKVYVRGGYSWLHTGTYALPDIYLNGAINFNGSAGIIYDYYIQNYKYYQFCLPNTVALSRVTDEAGVDDFPVWVKHYNGALRAADANATSWEWYNGDNFEAGIGYIIAAKPRQRTSPVADDVRIKERPLSIIRFPLGNSAYTSSGETDKEVSTTGHGVAGYNANPRTVTANNVGWNFVGNPFMATWKGDIGHRQLVKSPDDEHWDGSYKWVDAATKYITVMSPEDGTDYDQYVVSTTELKPFFPFYIQETEASGTLNFAASTRLKKAPAMLRADKEPREAFVQINIECDEAIDQTGMFVSDRYSDELDLDDYEKMFGRSTEKPKIWLMHEGTRMAFEAVTEERAANATPLGYRAPQEGEYTLSIDADASKYAGVAAVYLNDNVEGVTDYDLLLNEYVFTSNPYTFNDTRFTVRIELKDEDEVATGIEPTGGGDKDRPLKFLYRDKMYILRNGVIYDATGKKVSNN